MTMAWMQHSLEQSVRQHWIPEDITTFSESAVRGHNHGAFFIAGINQLEEQVGAAKRVLGL